MPSFVLAHDPCIVPILSQARDVGTFDEDIGSLGSSMGCWGNCGNGRAKSAILAVRRHAMN